MPTVSVSIPTVTEVGSYVLYDLEIKIEVNKKRIEHYRISKRFSDFVELRKELEHNKEVDGLNVPGIPSKYSSFYKSSQVLIDERKAGLTSFVVDILNNPQFRISNTVLNFFNIPRSVVLELNIQGGGSDNKKTIGVSKYASSVGSGKIESAQQWMEMHKLVKSLLQDSRSKMFGKGNVVEIKKTLKACETKIELLKMYLSTTKDLGAGEIRRRKELLIVVTKELTELNDLLINMKFSSSVEDRNGVNSNKELFNTKRNSGGRRTFGKLKETEITKKLDNMELLQLQKQEMQAQDQSISELKDMIIRQKQIGSAVNEELTIQNELLDSFNRNVDDSTMKMRTARNRINKIL